MAAIRLRRVSRQFDGHWAVREVDLQIEAGQTVALIGPSGSGKTTVLRLVNRLLEATAGSVEVFGEDVRRTDPAELRRQIGYVIQEIGLFPHYDVARNIATVPRLLGWSKERIGRRTAELLELVGLPPGEFAGRYPRQLSGGQRQRVGFARALAADPAIILLDEPFGALDPIAREALQDEFSVLARRLAKTFVFVTHDIFEAVRVAERIVVLDGGAIVRDAPPAELVRDPQHPVVAGLLGRHRYQLALMTVTLGALLERPARAEPVRDAASIELDAALSVWDALSRLSLANATAVRVAGRDGPELLSREALLRVPR
jgi:osmoprotectant transport system ATP-binding protein